MKIKQAVTYTLRDSLRSVCIFYVVCYGLMLIAALIQCLEGNPRGSMSNLDSASFIFLFVTGLNSFKVTFRLFVQNGLSRKTLLVGFIINAFILSCMIALVDSTHVLFFQDSLGYRSLYQQVFSRGASTAQSYWTGLLWSITGYFFVCSVGFMITTLYYRLSKGLKIAISVGVPSFIMVGLPIIIASSPHLAIWGKLYQFLGTATGFVTKNPFHPILASSAFALVALGISYLLIRKAPVKEA